MDCHPIKPVNWLGKKSEVTCIEKQGGEYFFSSPFLHRFLIQNVLSVASERVEKGHTKQ